MVPAAVAGPTELTAMPPNRTIDANAPIRKRLVAKPRGTLNPLAKPRVMLSVVTPTCDRSACYSARSTAAGRVCVMRKAGITATTAASASAATATTSSADQGMTTSGTTPRFVA